MLTVPGIPGCVSFCPDPYAVAAGHITTAVSALQWCEDVYFSTYPQLRTDLPAVYGPVTNFSEPLLSDPTRFTMIQVPGLSIDPPNGTPAVFTVVNSTSNTDPPNDIPATFSVVNSTSNTDPTNGTSVVRASTDSPGRCGPEHNDTHCPQDQCCSHAGYCGTTPEHCRVPESCQHQYGVCASDEMPVALLYIPPPWYLAPLETYASSVELGPIIAKCTQKGTVAITFDDGPSQKTQAIVDLLRQYKAKATFFVSGNTNARGAIDQYAKWIDLIRRMHHDGHQIGSHTWSHPHLDRISSPDRLREMLYNDIAIHSITQASPRYMRPPYLECSGDCLEDMYHLGYHVVGYEIDTRDTEGLSFEEMKSIVDDALAKKAPGESAQFILHDHSDHVIPLTQYILEKTSDLKAVTMAECLGDDPENVYLACHPNPLLPLVIGLNATFALIAFGLVVYWVFLCFQSD